MILNKQLMQPRALCGSASAQGKINSLLMVKYIPYLGIAVVKRGVNWLGEMTSII
jgi:hypothetical protein